jgi:hypothetical protein
VWSRLTLATYRSDTQQTQRSAAYPIKLSKRITTQYDR